MVNLISKGKKSAHARPAPQNSPSLARQRPKAVTSLTEQTRGEYVYIYMYTYVYSVVLLTTVVCQ